ncbi:hypothetical protein KAR91_06380 [Candidatus Pacearchaeota archaeon]|nr:hypothetical protein [Candidatus Pacearchaeota archaeon]
MLAKIKDLTKEQLIIGVCLVCLGLSILASGYYKNKATELEITLGTTATTLQIERKKAKLAGNLQERVELQDALDAMTKNYKSLSKKYNALLKANITYSEVMENLGEINNNQDICNAWDALGYPICE